MPLLSLLLKWGVSLKFVLMVLYFKLSVPGFQLVDSEIGYIFTRKDKLGEMTTSDASWCSVHGNVAILPVTKVADPIDVPQFCRLEDLGISEPQNEKDDE
ncbi:unnamed protein product [Gongylonema pulchrum]|uniref:Crinkler (CRN) n=1 Tax=Gongylonema pulchrum TaxID=637853 RepID=A0A183EB42_9BILA|nr:unnamed protein product [Gongylonema pulchrum]